MFKRMTLYKPSGVALALALSMSLTPILVNALPPRLTSVNKDKSSTRGAESNTTARETAQELIDLTFKRGQESVIMSNLARVIGLPKEMPIRKSEVTTKGDDGEVETRACHVVYERDPDDKKSARTHPVCAYIVRSIKSKLTRETQYYRIDLSGKLEKALTSKGKYDSAGAVIKGSGVKVDQDIASPEVRKAFQKEMAFWLKDWLPKQSEAAARKAAAAPGVKKPDSSPAR